VLIDDIVFDLIDCIYPQYSYARYKYDKYLHIVGLEAVYKLSLVKQSLREHNMTDLQEQYEEAIQKVAKIDAQIHEARNFKVPGELDNEINNLSDEVDNDLVEIDDDYVDYEQLFL
jgi:hypothetical protein